MFTRYDYGHAWHEYTPLSPTPGLSPTHDSYCNANNLGDEGRGSKDGGPPQKRARDAKYAIPTMEEACLLRETEGKLFDGNLLRLEVEELLSEVRVDHGKKSVKALEVREVDVLIAKQNSP